MTETIFTDGPTEVNGFTVLVYLGTDVAEGYVICDRGQRPDSPQFDRFVTWRVYRTNRVHADLTPVWEASWGHYFVSLRAALDDLDRRASR